MILSHSNLYFTVICSKKIKISYVWMIWVLLWLIPSGATLNFVQTMAENEVVGDESIEKQHGVIELNSPDITAQIIPENSNGNQRYYVLILSCISFIFRT